VKFERALQEVFEAHVPEIRALKITSTIANCLSQLFDRDALVRTDVKLEFLSNSDCLELQPWKNEILCEQAEVFLKSNSSSSYLKISSSRNYTQESSELQKNINLKKM
jgi:hypothetical protein